MAAISNFKMATITKWAKVIIITVRLLDHANLGIVKSIFLSQAEIRGNGFFSQSEKWKN